MISLFDKDTPTHVFCCEISETPILRNICERLLLKKYETCSKLTIKTTEQRQLRHSSVSIENIS